MLGDDTQKIALVLVLIFLFFTIRSCIKEREREQNEERQRIEILQQQELQRIQEQQRLEAERQARLRREAEEKERKRLQQLIAKRKSVSIEIAEKITIEAMEFVSKISGRDHKVEVQDFGYNRDTQTCRLKLTSGWWGIAGYNPFADPEWHSMDWTLIVYKDNTYKQLDIHQNEVMNRATANTVIFELLSEISKDN